MISAERYKKAMEELGKPNSNSALATLERLVHEAEFLERRDCLARHRIEIQDYADRYQKQVFAIEEQNKLLLRMMAERELMTPRVYVLQDPNL